LILLYLAGIAAATFTLTPAGIGVVEVAVAATATSFGIGKTDAMASALLYRGISSWLVIAAGWVIFAVLRRTPTPTDTDAPGPTKSAVEPFPNSMAIDESSLRSA
jgi:uncharacterized protein (TIRG00374 family)